jgi:hypothetical protein
MRQKIEKQKRVRRYIPRETWRFQLRLDNSIDTHVRDILKYAETQRRSVTMIRDGVRLLWALENDDLSVLFDLFPKLKERFEPNSADLLEEFRQMLVNHHPSPPDIPTLPSLSKGSAKPLLAPEVPMPTFEDEDTMVVRRDVNAGANTTANFLDAAFGFQKREDD